MKILIADDDEMTLGTLRKYLAFRGDRVQAISDGADAVALIGADVFDLVITDIRMPGASGFDVLKAVKAKQPDIPVRVMRIWIWPLRRLMKGLLLFWQSQYFLMT